MACEMQKIEVEIVIKDAVARLQEEYPGNIFLTIHDCIVCEEELIDAVKTALNCAVKRKIGILPGLDVKPIHEPVSFNTQLRVPRVHCEHDEMGVTLFTMPPPTTPAKIDRAICPADDDDDPF